MTLNKTTKVAPKASPNFVTSSWF